MATIFLSGCDYEISIEGNIERKNGNTGRCEMILFTMMGPIWGDKKPEEYRRAEIDNNFNQYWVISGPQREHWVEIRCPEEPNVFRSNIFDAPTENQRVNLGNIKFPQLQRTDYHDVMNKRRGDVKQETMNGTTKQ